jgi:SNF family Na+-dependent transporter
MLTVLIIRGATLSGAIEGVKFYIGSVNFSVLKNPNVSFTNDIQRSFFVFEYLGMERSMYTSFLCLKLL